MNARVMLATSLTLALVMLQAPVFAQSNTNYVPNLVLDAPALPPAVRTQEENVRYGQFNVFLQQTGFPDLPERIAKTLASPAAQSMEDINRQTLEGNWQRLQLINYARDLGAEILTKLTPMLGNRDGAAKAAELVARLMSQKRLLLPDAFPDAIRNIKNNEQRVAAKEQYLNQAIEKNIIRMQEQIVSDVLHTVYGKEKVGAALNGSDPKARGEMAGYIAHLDILAKRYVRALYSDHEMGLGRWLGEAVALGVVHTSRISNDPEVKKFEALLNSRAYAHGEYLSDFTSDTLTFEDQKGQRKQIKIKHADTITELYSLATGSRMSAAGPRPNIFNRWKAHKNRLLQLFVFAAVTADESKSKWKAIDGQEPSFAEKIMEVFSGSAPGKVGASHAGMAYVYKNPTSGVAITRALDMYAFGGYLPQGGERFVSTKSIFATQGVFANFGVASLVPKLTLEYLQNLIREKGYQPVFKVSDVYRQKTPGGKMERVEGETFEWRPRITAEEQRRILDVRPEDADKWYNGELAPNMAEEALRGITDYGISFKTYGNDDNYKKEPGRVLDNKMSCYCSQGVNIVGYRETGFNLQSRPDTIYALGRLARFVYPKLEKVIPREVPVAPNFMAWDPKTEVDTAHFRIRNPVEAWYEQVQAPRRDFDTNLTSMISSLINRSADALPKDLGPARYPHQSLIEYAEVSVVPVPDKPNHTVFEPRANPMGVSTSEAPKMTYNLVPPNEVKFATISEADLKSRRALHGTLLTAAKYSVESEAAGFILAELAPRMKDDATLTLVQALTAKMVALKPINPPRILPPELKSVPGNGQDSAVEKYITRITAELVETQTRQILSDVTGILYGKTAVDRAVNNSPLPADQQLRQKIDALYLLIGAEVRKMYVDPTFADTRALGMNLAIGLVNSLLKADKTQNITVFGENLKTYGFTLQDLFEGSVTSEKTKNAVKLGDLSGLKPRANPGEILRVRLSQPNNGRAPRAAELAQLRFSPYAEAQPDLTRSLDVMFNRKPVFLNSPFKPQEKKGLVQRSVVEYMDVMNREQMGKNGRALRSDFLEANPLPPAKPFYPQRCEDLIGR